MSPQKGSCEIEVRFSQIYSDLVRWFPSGGQFGGAHFLASDSVGWRRLTSDRSGEEGPRDYGTRIDWLRSAIRGRIKIERKIKIKRWDRDPLTPLDPCMRAAARFSG